VVKSDQLSSHVNFQVYIVDEADHMIEEQAVSFAKVGANAYYTIFGLSPTFHSTKTYFCSAAFDEQVQGHLLNIFDIRKHEIHDFENLATVATSAHRPDFEL